MCIQETRCRGQVTGSCRGFGVFAAAADKAGRGGVELWIRQDIMGYPRSFHVLVAEPRFLLVNGHTAAGVRHRSRMGGRSSRSFQSKSSRAFGPDAIPSELIAVGGQGYRRALDVLCAKVLKEGAPMLWKGGDVVAVPRKPGPLTPSNTRGVLCSSCPGKMYASVLRAAAVPWQPLSAGMSQTGAVRGGGTEFAFMTRSLFSSWAQLGKLSSAVIFVETRKAFHSVLVEEVGRSRDGAK